MRTLLCLLVASGLLAGCGGDGSSDSGSTAPLPVTLPAAPTGLTATSGDQQITLQWNGVPQADSYRVRRADASGGPYSVISSVTTVTITDIGLVNGTQYFYVLSAINSAGESTISAEVSGTPEMGASGWIARTSGTLENLRGVWFISQNGWAVGENGALLQSTDGGVHWNSKASGTSSDLSKVQFADSLHGWIVGHDGTVLATTDGGTTWTPTGPGLSFDFNALSFVSSQAGWIVGDDTNVYKTGDGGVTWLAQPTGTDGNFHAVKFVDAHNGWIIGTISVSGDERDIVLRTTDGGTTWTEQMRTEFHNQRLRAVEFVDTTLGWIPRTTSMLSNNGGVFASGDGGATWTKQGHPDQGGFLNLHFVSTLRGWGAGTFGAIGHTEDGGATWTSQVSPVGNDYPTGFMDIHIDPANPNRGWIVGSDGVLLSTTTGGE